MFNWEMANLFPKYFSYLYCMTNVFFFSPSSVSLPCLFFSPFWMKKAPFPLHLNVVAPRSTPPGATPRLDYPESTIFTRNLPISYIPQAPWAGHLGPVVRSELVAYLASQSCDYFVFVLVLAPSQAGAEQQGGLGTSQRSGQHQAWPQQAGCSWDHGQTSRPLELSVPSHALLAPCRSLGLPAAQASIPVCGTDFDLLRICLFGGNSFFFNERGAVVQPMRPFLLGDKLFNLKLIN